MHEEAAGVVSKLTSMNQEALETAGEQLRESWVRLSRLRGISPTSRLLRTGRLQIGWTSRSPPGLSSSLQGPLRTRRRNETLEERRGSQRTGGFYAKPIITARRREILLESTATLFAFTGATKRNQ